MHGPQLDGLQVQLRSKGLGDLQRQLIQGDRARHARRERPDEVTVRATIPRDEPAGSPFEAWV